ncbi:transcriptional regulator, TetR family [Ruminococcaceae bacterium YRB3002]|nr:transcriptional regulator, TetR family [Ruminococcaceae bacterium YRB3002]
MRKEDKLALTKDKLLQAAIKLMKETDNPGRVTSRAIAAEAGVPLGMVNYCYGGRENLLYEAFASNKDEYLTDGRFTEIMERDIAPKEKIRELYYLVADFLVNEYKYTRAITGHILMNRDLKEGLTSYPLVKTHYGDAREEWEIRMITYELSSMMQLVIYRLADMDEYLGMELEAKENLHRLIDLQVDLLLQDVQEDVRGDEGA